MDLSWIWKLNTRQSAWINFDFYLEDETENVKNEKWLCLICDIKNQFNASPSKDHKKMQLFLFFQETMGQTHNTFSISHVRHWHGYNCKSRPNVYIFVTLSTGKK